MKIKVVIKILLFTLPALTVFANIANAQNSKNISNGSKATITKEFIDSPNFVFIPQFVFPLRGGSRRLTSYYDLQVTKDSIISYLPYFGRAYTAPLNSSDIGFDFSSTNFQYKASPGKKGGWNILIRPANKENVQEMALDVFDNSSATLRINGVNRDPISFQGYVTSRDQRE